MTRRQENVITMWHAVDTVLSNQENAWSGLPAMVRAIERFRSLRRELDPDAMVQKTGTVGITAEKQALRDRLNNAVGQLAANLQAYALEHDKKELLQEVRYFISDIIAMRDNILPIVARKLLENADRLGKELTEYGVSDGTLQELSGLLTQYEGYNAAPRLAIGSRKAATAGIGQKIKAGIAQLEIMDRLVGNVEQKYPDFVAAFRNARKVIELGTHKTVKDKPATEQANS